MADFIIRLAGVCVGARVQHEILRDFCADYLVEGPAEEQVVLTQADIEAERARSTRQGVRADAPLQEQPDAYLESLALYRKIADLMVVHDTILFHGCVLAADGQAYLFTAPSGTGKTTHARFWLRKLPGAHILNGDKPLLRVTGEGVLACGTPWQGKEHLGCNECLPLAGLCVLSRDVHDHIEPARRAELMPTLVGQLHRPDDPAALMRAVELLGELAERVPLYRMGCTLDENSALVSHAAMLAGARV